MFCSVPTPASPDLIKSSLSISQPGNFLGGSIPYPFCACSRHSGRLARNAGSSEGIAKMADVVD